ncbi:LD-carboxypeptidase [Rouxiella badensis]|uniref:S66 family peptidase n=1 Tax=Rouxiella badensis TaxID=1646377 RepID=UPI0013EF0F26|nr:S66 peptidase family protein [Rouxiella badensis]MCC3701717.1 LD-carboxypeptidase [Rouxiella badensis]MCC3748766.1 LD-carboxypeptidase [Rouxiella badensis]QII38437.1 LD-carboxypeptidase [Rouxiella badensis]
MTIRFPKKLCPDDVIAITAPSMGVPASLHTRLDLAIDVLKSRKYRVLEGQCLRAVHKNKSAVRTLRAAELSDFLLNAEINAVMPPWGGELAMELLELIDFEGLAQVKPKWFSGFSDLSTLHFPLTLICGWATLHGPNLMELGSKERDVTTEAIWLILEGERGEVVEQFSSPAYQIEGSDWREQPDAGFNLTHKTEWKRLDGSTLPMEFKGRLIGGCIETISRLAGTRFGDVPKFCEQHKQDGVILYFENAEMAPCELTRTLLSLKMHGWFDGVAGVLFGRSAAPAVTDPTLQNYHDALESALGDLSIPVLYDVDIGHVPPQLSLVNGAMAKVRYFDKGGMVAQLLE